MCFGEQTTGEKTSTPTINPALGNAASGNLAFAQNIENTPYQAYTGQQVADLTPLQQQAFSMAGAVGGSTNPYLTNSQSLINQYSSTPASQVTPQTISSGMSPYISSYVADALKPTMQQMQIGFDTQNQADAAAATSSGAYGDARAGIQKANTGFLQNIMGTGTVANAYNTAFNTAIGASAQDASNNLTGQTTNANLNETALQRALGGSSAYTALNTSQLGNQTAQEQLLAQAGGTQQQQQQAELNVPYNTYLQAQQYPFLQLQAGNSAITADTAALPPGQTQVTSAPDNSGYQLAGSVLGSMFSDIRLKEDIDKIGTLNDGLPVYSFRYKGDPTKRIGLMAQDVEKIAPDAVHEVGGFKAVDYDKATERARAWAPAV